MTEQDQNVHEIPSASFAVGEEFTLGGVTFEVYKIKGQRLTLVPTRKTLLRSGDGLPAPERRAYLTGFVDAVKLAEDDRAKFLFAYDVAREKLKIPKEERDPLPRLAKTHKLGQRIETILARVEPSPGINAAIDLLLEVVEHEEKRRDKEAGR